MHREGGWRESEDVVDETRIMLDPPLKRLRKSPVKSFDAAADSEAERSEARNPNGVPGIVGSVMKKVKRSFTSDVFTHTNGRLGICVEGTVGSAMKNAERNFTTDVSVHTMRSLGICVEGIRTCSYTRCLGYFLDLNYINHVRFNYECFANPGAMLVFQRQHLLADDLCNIVRHYKLPVGVKLYADHKWDHALAYACAPSRAFVVQTASWLQA